MRAFLAAALIGCCPAPNAASTAHRDTFASPSPALSLGSVPAAPPIEDASLRPLLEAIDAPACREHIQYGAEELRQHALAGYLPCQSAKKEAFAKLLAELGKTEGTSVHARNATIEIEGRMDESLAADWAVLSVAECSFDPTMCASAAAVATNAIRVWLDRAVERYALCALLAGYAEQRSMEAWCDARIAAIAKSPRFRAPPAHPLR